MARGGSRWELADGERSQPAMPTCVACTSDSDRAGDSWRSPEPRLATETRSVPSPLAMRPPAQQGALPPGWRELADPASGQPYYHHMAQDVTTWDRPGAAAGQSRVPASFNVRTVSSSRASRCTLGWTKDRAESRSTKGFCADSHRDSFAGVPTTHSGQGSAGPTHTALGALRGALTFAIVASPGKSMAVRREVKSQLPVRTTSTTERPMALFSSPAGLPPTPNPLEGSFEELSESSPDRRGLAALI